MRALTSATAQVLDVGRETRVWSVAQRRAVELRDDGCRFPVGDGVNCGRPMGWTDIHHVTGWRHGGSTAVVNGVLLCGHHRRLVHHDGWDLTLCWAVLEGLGGLLDPGGWVARAAYIAILLATALCYFACVGVVYSFRRQIAQAPDAQLDARERRLRDEAYRVQRPAVRAAEQVYGRDGT